MPGLSVNPTCVSNMAPAVRNCISISNTHTPSNTKSSTPNLPGTARVATCHLEPMHVVARKVMGLCFCVDRLASRWKQCLRLLKVPSAVAMRSNSTAIGVVNVYSCSQRRRRVGSRLSSQRAAGASALCNRQIASEHCCRSRRAKLIAAATAKLIERMEHTFRQCIVAATMITLLLPPMQDNHCILKAQRRWC